MSMAVYKAGTGYALLLTAALALALATMSLGPGEVNWQDGLDWLLGRAADAHAQLVLVDLRLPRLLKAVALGAALGAAGVLLQAATRNPLADTGLLGVNSGAALGVAGGIAWLGESGPADQIGWALTGALAGCALVLFLAGAGRGRMSPLRMVLAGLALGATCQSATAWIALAGSANLDRFRFWLLGSLAHPHAGLLAPGLVLIGLGLCAAVALVRPLSALVLGDELASALGYRPATVRVCAVGAVALLSGTSVALAGPISFLGLLAPYCARALAGVSLKAQLAYAIPLGSIVMMAADLAARLAIAPFEAPVGAVLALIGAPLLIWIVHREPNLGFSPHGAER
ncbi:iron ABC transporter permease [Methylomonas sp. EFPC3]|uniref:FecCD family ABC transporter permease n=1 Tax=unclassified Methylomonas TaxID=2608980 RepID=UPI0024170F74|nr:iron ABC transporter permease [Methylomonas sp. EFPC3]WFP50551.1 iron ABC transporter permease [Methylomonas sp. EFPC3]